jgi:hypothetical protein
VGDYLRRLEAASAGLPPDRRSELLEGIQEHIASAQASRSASPPSGVYLLSLAVGPLAAALLAVQLGRDTTVGC